MLLPHTLDVDVVYDLHNQGQGIIPPSLPGEDRLCVAIPSSHPFQNIFEYHDTHLDMNGCPIVHGKKAIRASPTN